MGDGMPIAVKYKIVHIPFKGSTEPGDLLCGRLDSAEAALRSLEEGKGLGWVINQYGLSDLGRPYAVTSGFWAKVPYHVLRPVRGPVVNEWGVETP